MTVTIKGSGGGGVGNGSGNNTNNASPAVIHSNENHQQPSQQETSSSPSTQQSLGEQQQQQPMIVNSTSTHLSPSFSSTFPALHHHRPSPSPDARDESSVSEDDPHQSQVPTETELTFPVDKLAHLDDMINRPRWVIPVLPKGELEVLLEASIALAKKGLDVSCEPCQRFYRDGLVVSFTKILTDDAVTGWKTEIHVSCLACNTTNEMVH